MSFLDELDDDDQHQVAQLAGLDPKPKVPPPSPYQPITPAGKQSLDRVISETDADKAEAQRAFDRITKSGMSDTLQAILGKHTFGLDPSMAGTTTLARNNFGKGIYLNPASLSSYDQQQKDAVSGRAAQDAAEGTKMRAYMAKEPMDTAYMAPGSEASATLAHEFGHTAESSPPLFPGASDLYSQWKDIVSKKQSLSDANKLGLMHGGWNAGLMGSGPSNRGADEMFADAFASAVNLLRRGENGDQGAYTKQLRSVEQDNPGTIYLSKWLVRQPAFQNHPATQWLKGDLK